MRMRQKQGPRPGGISATVGIAQSRDTSLGSISDLAVLLPSHVDHVAAQRDLLARARRRDPEALAVLRRMGVRRLVLDGQEVLP